MSSVVLFGFSVESLRYNSVAILNYVGSLTMALEALLAALEASSSNELTTAFFSKKRCMWFSHLNCNELTTAFFLFL